MAVVAAVRAESDHGRGAGNGHRAHPACGDNRGNAKTTQASHLLKHDPPSAVFKRGASELTALCRSPDASCLPPLPAWAAQRSTIKHGGFQMATFRPGTTDLDDGVDLHSRRFERAGGDERPATE